VSVTWEDARWADGPKVAAWVDEHTSFLSKSSVRAVYRWRNGAVADFFALDRLLTAAGFHVSDLPADVWAEGGPPNRHVPTAPRGRNAYAAKLTEADVIDIRREVRCGEAKKALARRYGVSPKTISNVAKGWTWGHVKEPAA
jgi:hypothetical protein